ncbi:hypothetical protein PAMP_024346 [Pampus punctatissimus]
MGLGLKTASFDCNKRTLAHISTHTWKDNVATIFDLLLNQGLPCHSTLPPSGALRVHLPPGLETSSR